MRLRTLFAVGSLLASCLALGQIHDPVLNKDGTLNKTAGLGITQRLDGQVDLGAEFVDEAGAKVKLGDYFGKRPVLLNLIFYKCPGMCSLELDGLVSSFTKMTHAKTTKAIVGEDVDIVTISIDPNEGPDLAAAKKESICANFDYPLVKKGWHFLTGSYENINRVVTSVGFEYTYDKQSKNINHPAGVMIATPAGKIAQYFYGTAYPERPLHDSIFAAKNEKIGKLADVYLLGCLCRDAMTGKWSVNVMQTTRVLGILTLVTLIGGIVKMNLSHKKNMSGDAAKV